MWESLHRTVGTAARLMGEAGVQMLRGNFDVLENFGAEEERIGSRDIPSRCRNLVLIKADAC